MTDSTSLAAASSSAPHDRDMRRLRALNARLNYELQGLERRLTHMEQSLSWRVTMPLRVTGSLLRRARMYARKHLTRHHDTDWQPHAPQSSIPAARSPASTIVLRSMRISARLPSLPIVITGAEQYGTTFLAHVLRQGGYDFGLTAGSIGSGTGDRPIEEDMEHEGFHTINTRMLEMIRKDIHVEDIIGELGEHLSQPLSSAVKSLSYCRTYRVWEAAGAIPEHLFLCMRDPDETADDTDDPSPDDVEATNGLLRHAIEHHWPHTVIFYPRIGRDAAYADLVLGEFMEHASDIVQRLWPRHLYHRKHYG